MWFIICESSGWFFQARTEVRKAGGIDPTLPRPGEVAAPLPASFKRSLR
jgi:hypothetical protein